MKKMGLGLLLMLAMLTPSQLLAADARDYIPAPPGTTVFLVYQKDLNASELYSDGHKVSSDFNLDVDVTLFRLVHFEEVFGVMADFQAILPVEDSHLDGAGVGGNSFSGTGISDPIFLATFWAINDPANKTWLGITPFITVPLGKYDENQVLNPGKNRWAGKLEVGFNKGIGEKGYLDLIGSVEAYTDNDDFGGVTKEQDPVYVLNAYYSYDITDRFWASIDYGYTFGGETKVNGVSQNDEMGNHVAGFSFAYGIGDNYQLLLQYKEAIDTKGGPALNDLTARFLIAF